MTPDKIQLHKKSRTLELHFGTQVYHLSAEYLRVHSPSAEVKGHGPGQAILQHGKKRVGIADIQMAGHYALTIHFDDGHDSGIFTWAYLHDLCVNQDAHWQAYLDALDRAGQSRDPDTSVVNLIG
ncbi:gamma-butyrobetaine hydroxylase-like domain-containing protein [Marinimicrobium alkaliphilum]|uniref:gamma-butyrobetaine hydroxylase-like domain-containing protein n=1 Tax=Marinimicrobium alkaliphilum TaxID=2202654 RepID=UPI000DB9B2C4|nr:DUF971 domain-containing protein [Marinimicrobium alkaliphilum]